MLPLPFYLLRVLDLTTGPAGAYASRAFADLGAEVIKIDDRRRPDPLREDDVFYGSLNRNKLGLSLDLGSDAGRELCLRLVSCSEIVLLDDGAIDDEALRPAREDVIAVSIKSTDAGSAETGLAAAGAAMAALFHRRDTGAGQRIEVSVGDVEASLGGVESDDAPGSEVASPLLTLPGLVGDRQLRARGFFEDVARRNGAIVEMDGVPYRFSRTPAHVRLPAPEPGDYVLRELLGLDEAEIERLRAAGIAGDRSDRAQ